MGHPAPFNMKFLGIGNEQWDEFYFKRVKIVADAVRKAHPEIKIIGTSGPNSEGGEFDRGWEAMKRQKADLVDEHFYRPISWFKNEWNRYDLYDRTGPKVFAGEYACHDRGKKWNHAGASIYEAAFITGIERNADVVHMATYAPLFAHEEGWQWRPDLIWMDNLRTVRTPNYYVQQLYAMNPGTNVLSLTEQVKSGKKTKAQAVAGQDGLCASAVFDKTTKQYIVKVVNTGTTDQPIEITFKGIKNLGNGKMTTLHANGENDVNTIENKNVVVPKTSDISAEGNVLKTTVPAKTFAVFKF
jgi:alpha-L-arabinofuranosidase